MRTSVRWRRLVVVGVAAVLFVAGLVVGRPEQSSSVMSEEPVVAVNPDFVPPFEWVSPAWAPFFGFEDWWDADLSALSALPSDVPDGAVARDVAVSALVADLRGTDTLSVLSDGPFPPPWSEFSARCDRVDVLGAHAAALPLPERFGQVVAKTVVVWTGDCVDGLPDAVLDGADVEVTETSVQVAYVFVERVDGSWIPVRETALPGSGAGAFRTGAIPVPEELFELSACVSSVVVVHVDLVAAAEQLCADALRDGVPLRFTSGYRSAAEQRERFDAAVDFFDDETVAAQQVAWDASGRCASRHCVGAAVDVDVSSAGASGVAAWLTEPVGCSGGTSWSSGCPADETAVVRAQLYGFSVPLPWQPGHLEWSLPPAQQLWFTSCDPSPALAVQQQIAAVWRCRLAQEGFSREQIREAVARAVVVSRCVSGWNTSYLADGGLFVDTPDPDDRFRTEAGLFGLPREVADRLIDGGWAGASDGVANASAAVELFVESVNVGRDGFSFWDCDSSGPVPDWAYGW